MGKIAVSGNRAKPHQGSLYKDITTAGGNLKTSKKKRPVNATSDNEDDEEVVLDASSSRKILQLAREQQEEIEEEENKLHKRQDEYSRFNFQDSDESDDDEEDQQEYDEMSNFGSDYEEEEVEEIDADEAEMFDSYFRQQSGNPLGSFNLADKVMAKIQEKQMQMKMQAEGITEQRPSNGVSLPPRVIEAYTKVGVSLASWRNGKLPKLFKVLPSVKNWEDLLYVTNPESWTPQVVYEATKLFVSNLTASKAERFVNMVLYPRFRQDIEDDDAHKLNYHLYRSLKKSIYKPAAFFKGFLMPLVEEECTVREAVIVGSVLSKISIPVLHSAAALGWLLEREFTPASMVFIRVLVEKKYALPYQTIDSLVFFFMRFRTVTDAPTRSMEVDDEEDVSNKKKAPVLPLVWHKALLAFAERYKNDITEDQRDFLMEVVRQRGHKDISPVVRRELLAGQNRADEEAAKESDPMSYF
ncbi:unnamed protein product [Kuraishia capsulata CBS 1993]|uniref:Uncharacterized protein n=1 Tax=Kuraishia capsulata CBS 1993 TaxID=1382522 RepID=W6MFI5_9ASCO|nr:uncharacterized protein KUCA_T00000540001 [Kuraishia capsulata CBS 1993]CDK24574.1 unnamed protein product [Kuraishia capsulata CBS 1993]